MTIPFSETRAPEPEPVPLAALAEGAEGRKRWRAHWIWAPLWGLYAYSLHYGLRLLPPILTPRVGARLGRIAAWHHRKAKFVGRMQRMIQLIHKRSGAGSTPAEAVLPAWFEHTGRALVEFAQVDRFYPRGDVEVVGREHFDAAMALGRPVIITGVHLANWEALIALVFHRDFAPDARGVYQPQPNRFENRMVHWVRKRHGGFMLPPGPKTAFRLMSKLKDERGVLLLFIDEVHEKNIQFPLFGRPVPASGNIVNMAKFALATDAILLPAFNVRVKDTSFRLTFLPPVEAERSGSKNENIAVTVRRMNAIYEPIVRDHLEQWYMLAELRMK
ncbi:lysophospholipid acyltransferase family protein [Oryzibacter oryziterrae]|uniref:lysophospholipid acyltransferase family protein n=1 Tax=Oryzibacter oryziterrae TaxID=2766474 RepID=UPI001F2E0C12|nr:lysophospholipid acyltransferase family protein [Oryzibacter oryziterrae]